MDQDTGKPISGEAQGEAEQPKPIPSDPLKTIESTTKSPHGNNGKNQGCNKHKSSWPTRFQAGCAAALVIITGLYTHYAGQQLDIMRITLSEIKKATELNIAVESPEIHIAGMRLTTGESLEDCKTKSTASLPPDDPKADRVCIVIENMGLRPATLRNFYISHFVGQNSYPAPDIPKQPLIPDGRFDPRGNGWIEDSDGLRPGRNALGGILASFHLTPEELKTFKSGEELWIYGVLDADMFLGSPTDQTQKYFCDVWSVKAQRFTEDRSCREKGKPYRRGD